MQPTLHQCPLITKRLICILGEDKHLPCLGKMTKNINNIYSDFFDFFGVLVGLAKQEGSGRRTCKEKTEGQKSAVGVCVARKNGKRD